MSLDRTTMEDLIESVRNEIADNFGDIYESTYPEARLHEIVDAVVPVYNGDLVDLLADDYTLAFPVDCPDEDPNAFDIISWSVYERLREEAQPYYEGLAEEEEENRAELERGRIEAEEEDAADERRLERLFAD